MSRRIALIVALGSVCLSFVQSSVAQGTIQYFQPSVPIPLHTDLFSEYLPLDFDGDGNAELTFAYDFHFVGVRSDNASRLLFWLAPPPNIAGDVAPLPLGFQIGPASGFGSLQWFGDDANEFDRLIQTFDSGSGGAFVGQHAYMGVEFQRAGNTHYGWLWLQIGETGAFGRIDGWAWETRPGIPIFAGAVPEPSTLVLLATGITLTVRRRRKSL